MEGEAVGGVRRALVVRGGWEGHAPVACTDRFLPILERNGFECEVSEDFAAYEDAARMARTDLVVHCWSIGEMERAAARGLAAAVEAGTGLAGWHGGIVDSVNALAFMHLVGARFVYHPRGFVDHELTVVPERRDHPITAGIDVVRLTTEKYWVLTDPLCDVLATVTFPPDHPGDADDGAASTPWRREVTLPAVWTRQWGSGRVFVSAIGHRVEDFDVPEVQAITERGLLWAAREVPDVGS
jgi:uncharacterized protein